MFNSWEEVYFGYDEKVFYAILHQFTAAEIDFRDKKSNIMRNRMVQNIIFGGNPLIMNTAGMNKNLEYHIFVKRSDRHRAEEIVQNVIRS